MIKSILIGTKKIKYVVLYKMKNKHSFFYILSVDSNTIDFYITARNTPFKTQFVPLNFEIEEKCIQFEIQLKSTINFNFGNSF